LIAIVSSSAAERSALAALCTGRGWPVVECDSLRAMRRLLRTARPRVVIVRRELGDGYADAVITALAASGAQPVARIIVLLERGGASNHESRQLALGADHVLRDPVRADVLAEYVEKYLAHARRAPAPKTRTAVHPRSFRFTGATIFPVERELRHGRRSAHLTPREVQLAELLAESPGEVISYATLYDEILRSRFRGDTGSMRVLLARLDASFRSAGLRLRHHVKVIPKAGYRYSPQGSAARLA
jgi:DNA-binding response OmpR family regulator